MAEEGADLHESGQILPAQKTVHCTSQTGDKIYTTVDTSRILADQYKWQELNTVITRSSIPSQMAKNQQFSQQKAQMSMN